MTVATTTAEPVRLDACPLCGSERSEVLHEHWDYEFLCSLHRCEDCELMYLDPVPTKELILDRLDMTSEETGDAESRIANAVLNLLDKWHPPPGKLLQLGCGNGHLLAAARRRGWQAHGVESYAAASEPGGSGPDAEIFHGELSDSPFEQGSYDVVVAWHVLEGVPEPVRVLRQMRSYLRPGGALALQVPGIAGLPAAIEQGRGAEVVWLARLSYFQESAFARIIKEGGYVHHLLLEDSATGFLTTIARRPEWPDPVQLDGCPLCGSEKAHVFLQHLDPIFLCWLSRCTACDFTYLNPIPSHRLIREWQDEDGYYDAHEPDRQLMENILSYGEERSVPPARLLEIGCSQGSLLVVAGERGWEAHGVEISPSDFAHAQARLGDKVFNGELADSPFERDSYDLIVMWHVLEHIPRLRHFLREVRSYLRPGGALVLQVPGLDSLDALRDQGRISELVCPVHLSYFEPHTLRAALEGGGFVIDDLGVESGSRHLTARALRPL
ncbi:MAG: class I SAM-dependent methyltransferase [bacterium]|nr:class I SAM-dependent methyltransferase [bacterium]